MCTLWQRFGRTARALELEGKALFFVEPKHFDEVKAQRVAHQEEKKRKVAGVSGQKQPAAKHTRLQEPAENDKEPQSAAAFLSEAPDVVIQAASVGTGAQDVTGSTSDNVIAGQNSFNEAVEQLNSVEDPHAMRRAEYEKLPQLAPKRSKRSREMLEPAMDDLINAKTRQDLLCIRKPIMLYYGNDKQGT
jgi:ATP-dependent DNA helicase RecQ